MFRAIGASLSRRGSGAGPTRGPGPAGGRAAGCAGPIDESRTTRLYTASHYANYISDVQNYQILQFKLKSYQKNKNHTRNSVSIF